MVEGKSKDKHKIPVGTWSNEKRFEGYRNYTLIKPKPFYRVGKLILYYSKNLYNATLCYKYGHFYKVHLSSLIFCRNRVGLSLGLD